MCYFAFGVSSLMWQQQDYSCSTSTKRQSFTSLNLFDVVFHEWLHQHDTSEIKFADLIITVSRLYSVFFLKSTQEVDREASEITIYSSSYKLMSYLIASVKNTMHVHTRCFYFIKIVVIQFSLTKIVKRNNIKFICFIIQSLYLENTD